MLQLMIFTSVAFQDYRTRYTLDPLVKGKVEKELEVEATRQRAVVRHIPGQITDVFVPKA
jgi:hypothetical protein